MLETKNDSLQLQLKSATAIAKVLRGNKAVTAFTINKTALEIQDLKSRVEVNLSGKLLRVEDAISIAALIPLNVSCKKRFYCLLFTDIAVIISLPRGHW